MLNSSVHTFSVPLPMPWRKPNIPTQTYTWTNLTANTTSHASSQLTLLPWITLISSSPVHSKKSREGKFCILSLESHCIVVVTKLVSDVFSVVSAARTLWGSMSPTLRSLFLDFTVLSMALMFLIPNSTLSLLEQTWVFTTHTLKLTRDSLPSILKLRSSSTVLLRTMSTSEYWTDWMSSCSQSACKYSNTHLHVCPSFYLLRYAKLLLPFTINKFSTWTPGI